MAKTIKTPLIQDIPKNPFGLNAAAFSTPIGATSTTGWGNPDELGSVALINAPREFDNALVTTSFERPLSSQELRYQLAEQQTTLGNILGFGANVVTSATAELLKTPGYIGGLMTGDYNNSWVSGISEMRDALDTRYQSRAAVEGGLTDKLLSGSYWATTVAETVGFAASFMVPGAALKALNIGGKLSKAAATAAKALGAEKAAATFGALNKVNKITNPIGKALIGGEISVAGTINSAASTMSMAWLESAAEGFNTYDEVRNTLEQNRSMGLNQFSDEEIDAMANTAGSKVQSGNMPILLLSNMIWGRMLFDKVGNLQTGKKSILKAVADPEARAALQQTIGKGLNPFKVPQNVFGKFVGKETTDGWLATNLIKGFITEGFLEEYQQTGLQRAIVEEAITGKQSDERFSLIDAVNPSSHFWDYLNKFAGTSWNWDDQQVESTVLGGLVGFGMQAPATRSQIAAHNSYLFGSAAYNPSRAARVFGAKSRPEATGLFSVVDNLKNFQPISLKPEQYKEFFIKKEDGTEVFDWAKANKYLSDSSNEAMHAAARMATLLERRKNLTDNAPDDLSREILTQIFAGEDIMASFGELMTNEYGADIFNQIVDDMIENQSNSIKELTGVEINTAQKKAQTQELKELAKLTNEAALEVIRNNNNFDDLSGYNPIGFQRHGDKATKARYRQGLLQTRLNQAVRNTIMERQQKNIADTLNTLKQTQTTQDLELEALNQLNEEYDKAEKELKEATQKKKDLSFKEKSMNLKKIENQRLPEEDRIPEEQLLAEYEAEKDAVEAQVQALEETVKSLKDQERLNKIEAAKKNQKNLKFTLEFLQKKHDSVDAVLNKGYIPQEGSEQNIIMAYDGTNFKGLKDFYNKLWNLDYIKKDYENFVKLEDARNKEAAKQEKINKIKDNSLAQIFNNAAEPTFIEYDAWEETGEVREDGSKVLKKVRKQATFFFSAGFTLKVLNPERSGFISIMEDDTYDGEMRIVNHVPSNSSTGELEHLIFKSDKVVEDEETGRKNRVPVTFKLYSDGTLEVTYNYGFRPEDAVKTKYSKHEYTLSSEGISDIDTTRELEQFEIDAIKNSIEKHKEDYDNDRMEELFRKAELTIFNKNYNKADKYSVFNYYEQPSVVLKDIDDAIKYLQGQLKDEFFTKNNRFYFHVKNSTEAARTQTLLKYYKDMKERKIQEFADMQNFLESMNSLASEERNEKIKEFKQALIDAQIQFNESKEELQTLLQTFDSFQDNLRAENYPLYEAIQYFGLNVVYKKDIRAIVKLAEILDDEQKKNPQEFQKYLDENKNSDFVKQLIELKGADDIQELIKFVEEEREALNRIIDVIESGRTNATSTLRELTRRINDNFLAIQALRNDNKSLAYLSKKYTELSDYNKRAFAVVHKNVHTDFQGLHTNDSPYDTDQVRFADMNDVELQDSEDLIRSAGNEFQPESQDATAFNGLTSRVLRDYYEDMYLAATTPEEQEKFAKYIDPNFVFNYSYFSNADESVGDVFKITKIQEWADSIKDIPGREEAYQRAKSMIADFYYYAFSRVGVENRQDYSAVFVTVHNIDKLPEQIRNDIYFYVESLGGNFNIEYIRANNIPLDSITDIKSVLINTKNFAKNPSDINSYLLADTFNNHVIASSIRDYSDSEKNTSQQIGKTFAVRSKLEGKKGVTAEEHENNKIQQIDAARQNHIGFRTALLEGINRNELTVTKEVKKISVGNSRTGIRSETEVNKALYGELTASKIFYGGYTKDGPITTQNRTGFFYLNTMGTKVLIRPRTLEQTNEVDKFFDLFMFATDPKNNADDRERAIKYLTKALWLKNSKASGKSAINKHFRLTIGGTRNDFIGTISFAGFENISAADLHKSIALKDALRKKLRTYNHNFNAGLLISRQNKDGKDKSTEPFAEYEVVDGKLKETIHANYREYLFNNENEQKNKGFVKFTQLKGTNNKDNLEKVVYMSPRTNTYIVFGEKRKTKETTNTQNASPQTSTTAQNSLTVEDVIDISNSLPKTKLTQEEESQVPEVLKEFVVEKFVFAGVNFIGTLQKDEEGKIVFSRDLKSLVSADTTINKQAREKTIKRDQFFLYKNKAVKISFVENNIYNGELVPLITIKYADSVNGVLTYKEKVLPLEEFNKDFSEEVASELINEYNSVKEFPFKSGETVLIKSEDRQTAIMVFDNNVFDSNGKRLNINDIEKVTSTTTQTEPEPEKKPVPTVGKKTKDEVINELETNNITYKSSKGKVYNVGINENGKLIFIELPNVNENTVLQRINAGVDITYSPKTIQPTNTISTSNLSDSINFELYREKIVRLAQSNGGTKKVKQMIRDYIDGKITLDDKPRVKLLAENIKNGVNPSEC